jgi:hypothetical protein
MKIAQLAGGLALLTIANAGPGVLTAPSFKVDDSWVFDETQQRGTTGFGRQQIDIAIERTDGNTMLVGLKRDGAPGAYEDHVVGTDWSQRRVVDGQEVPTTRPFAFPMKIGQSWTVDFADPTRRGLQTSLHVHRTYKVTGWEDVTVPAGTFHAIKVEASGSSEGVVVTPAAAVGGVAASPLGGSTFTHSQPGGTASRTVRDVEQIYYVPEVKNYVKSVEEQYNGDDVLVTRNTRMMVSYHPAT